ncbi:MAG: ribonuclease III [Sphingomonadales bacterium]|nr:ribonuclease III [Sphingomonadales bacterium]MBK9268781.1 ribonuclease III [Sphingomonadales bacterium]MBP6433603.1 ribonuclease III [Sphingorhabdus sp.]
MILSELSDWLEEIIGAAPTDLRLFEQALTHGSTGEAHYQRLEFLGDRVLGLVTASMLFQRFPEEPEGRLSHRLNALVAGSTCAEVAREIGLQAHMRLGKQARDDGTKESDYVLGDMVEALIGAIYLDLGLDRARSFIERYWRPLLESAKAAPKHPKSALQEWSAANNRKVPVYEVTSKEGPPHAMRFEVTVIVKGFDPVSATANSKQAAETAAAKAFLEKHT